MKIFRIILICVFGLVFLFSAYKLVMIMTEYRAGSSEYEDIQFSVVTENKMAKEELTSQKEESPADPELILEETTEEAESQKPREQAPIAVDFDALLDINADVVGWIYSEGTPINYPIVQGKDNDKYLRRTIRGEYNNAGSIFLDYRSKADFSGVFNVIYGHNLYTQEMFGSLLKYKKEGYYEDHSVLWLLTPQGDYKLHALAGFTLDASSPLYEFSMTEEGIGNFLVQAMKKSDFAPIEDDTPVENFLVLSTCSYEYDDARYILVTRMEQLDS